jgi:hypothetical protein
LSSVPVLIVSSTPPWPYVVSFTLTSVSGSCYYPNRPRASLIQTPR